MEKLSFLLPAALRRRGLQEQGAAALAVAYANQWLARHSPTLVPSVSVKRLKDGILTVECANAIALQELQAVSHRLQEALIQHHGVKMTAVRVVRS